MPRQVVLPNDGFLTYMLSELQAVAGKNVTLPVSGNSMRPFLNGENNEVLLVATSTIHVGDVVLAETQPGRYVLHRVVAIEAGIITLRGDGNMANEYCKNENIKATALGFYRNGSKQLDSTQDLKWRIYSWLWMRLYPVRRYLLFILYPHIPNCLRK